MKLKTSLEIRIYKKIKFEKTCHIWLGAVSSQGIPKIHFGSSDGSKTHIGVRHYLCEKKFGLSLNGKRISPECGNIKCVNPEHMLIYDAKAIRRKLTDEKAKEIREKWRLHLMHKTSYAELGRKYNVSRQCIEQLLKEKIRKSPKKPTTTNLKER